MKEKSTANVKSTKPDSQLIQRHTTEKKKIQKDSADSKRKPKFAKITEELQHATSSRTHRICTRFVVVFSVMIIVYFYTKNQTGETKFALVREGISLRVQKFECSPDYRTEIDRFEGCAPKKCGRFVADKLVEPKEAQILLDLAQRVITKAGGGAGGASILDIHTGAISMGEQFVNVFTIPQLVAEFRTEDLTVYNLVKGKIRLAIAEQFGISATSLHLTYPTFFSRLTNGTAQTMNDEYWHEHIDKDTYGSFHYTSVLYLNTHGKDFQGGRFIFVDGAENTTRTVSSIEPKLTRVSAFTSGAENRHHVEPVTEGERYAITIAFTCNKELAIPDPQLNAEPLAA